MNLAGHTKRLLESLKGGVDLGLKAFAVLAAFFATGLLAEQPDLRVNAEVAEIIDLSSVLKEDGPNASTCPTAEEGEPATGDLLTRVVCDFNDRVHANQGTQTEVVTASPGTWIALTRLRPDPGSNALIAPDRLQAVTAVVHPTGEAAIEGPGDRPEPAWILETLGVKPSRPRKIGPPSAWSEIPELNTCGDRVAVINARYGPIACLEPAGELVALEGSPGIPVYASQLAASPDIDASSLETTLDAIETAFAFDARLSITNQGKGNADDVAVTASAGFSLQAVDSAQPCEGHPPGRLPFFLKSADSCEIRYRSLAGSISEPDVPLTFGAQPSNAVPELEGWIRGVALLALVLAAAYVIAEYFAKE